MGAAGDVPCASFLVGILDKSGVGARIQGQIWENIDVGGELVVDGETVPAHPERVLMYLAKHAARGVAHYQRQIAICRKIGSIAVAACGGTTEACRCGNRRTWNAIILRFIASVVWFVGGVSRRLRVSKTLFGVVRLLVRLGAV